MFKKIFNKFKKEEPQRYAGDPMNSFNWFPICEDARLLDYVKYSLYKTNPKSFREEVKVNFKFVEYTTEVEQESVPKLPLMSVVDLMDKFDVATPYDFIRLSPGEGFIPKIIKIENPMFIMGDALKDYEIQIEQIGKYDSAKAKELKNILEDLKRADIGRAEADSKLQKLHGGSYDLIQSNPELKRDIIFEMGQRRTPTIKKFLGRDYCLLMSHYGKMHFDEERHNADGGVMLPILILEDAFKALPFGQIFMGRALGVIYFNPQPVFKNLGPGFVLIAAAISIGVRADILQRTGGV